MALYRRFFSTLTKFKEINFRSEMESDVGAKDLQSGLENNSRKKNIDSRFLSTPKEIRGKVVLEKLVSCKK